VRGIATFQHITRRAQELAAGVRVLGASQAEGEDQVRIRLVQHDHLGSDMTGNPGESRQVQRLQPLGNLRRWVWRLGSS
jgi:hypothetical protein